MHKEFEHLAKRFATYAPVATALDDAAWAGLAARIQVVLPAGGESKRLRGIVGQGVNKISAQLPNGDTLIEYNIRMYRDAGLTDVILLVGHESVSVERVVGDGSRLGVSVRYSPDPGKVLATGGAIRWALHNGILDRTKYMIVHNGGDIFFGYPGSIPRELAAHHRSFESAGSRATILSAPLSLVQGSILKIMKGYVEDVSYETYVPVPYHAAATMFSPEIFDYFERLFPVGEKMEFERVLFPILAKERKLTAMRIDNQYFLPVKNEKQWEQLVALFTKPV